MKAPWFGPVGEFRPPLRGLGRFVWASPRVPPALRSGSTLGYFRGVPPGLGVGRMRQTGCRKRLSIRPGLGVRRIGQAGGGGAL